MISGLFERGSNVDAYVVLGASNRRYLTKISTSFGCVVITPTQCHFITDSRYKIAAEAALTDYKIHIVSGSDLYQTVGEIVRLANLRTVGVEFDAVSYNEFRLLQDSLPDDVRFIPCDNVLTELRAVKTPEEIEKIAAAQQMTENALQKVFSSMKPRMTERDLYAAYMFQALSLGADGMAFDPIIASGVHAAEPHHHVSNTAIGHNVPVLFDVGVTLDGYCGDLSRTVCLGEADEQLRRIYDHVFHAQQYALSKIKAGITCNEADSFAREYLRSQGYIEEFGHALGHGVGLDIHEFPRVARNNDIVLRSNMVITVEPGVYVEGLGGVRIEDTVVVTEDGVRNLTSLHKKFEI